jgi:membrane-bound ClpP family serine protease
MDGWSGVGVSIPLEGVVDIGGGVVVGVVSMVVGVVVTTGFEVEEVVNVDVDVFEVVDVCTVVVKVGTGSMTASTQYDFPVIRLQSAEIDGFCSRC